MTLFFQFQYRGFIVQIEKSEDLCRVGIKKEYYWEFTYFENSNVVNALRAAIAYIQSAFTSRLINNFLREQYKAQKITEQEWARLAISLGTEIQDPVSLD